ncbi:MAG: ribonuclease HI [Cytophagales bacterium]|nr:ribonuclease HI [Cytophagales bacterium]
MEVKVYTDGACSGNPGPGAFAYIIIDSNDNILLQYAQGFEATTNNRMELMAVISALTECFNKGYDKVVVYSDSQYVVNAINKGWLISWQKHNFTGKKNVDLWQDFIAIQSKIDTNFIWIKGHDRNMFNERCDLLAKNAIPNFNN